MRRDGPKSRAWDELANFKEHIAQSDARSARIAAALAAKLCSYN